jgi:hypothetical protein
VTKQLKPEVRKTIFVKAKRDTYIYRMTNVDEESFIAEGTLMFHETNDNKYLQNDEIGVYLPQYGMCYSYRPDWIHERTISDG